MRNWIAASALAAFTVAVTPTGGDAEAGARLRFHYAPVYGDYDPEPEWAPPPRYYYYYEEPELDRLYEFDEGYYEPEYAGPEDEPVPVKPRKKVKPAASSALGAANKKVTMAKATTEESQPKSAAALSCDKATAIVSSYGFASVKAEDCQGQVYAFNATRDGKAYAVRLNAASGELTEVKKLQ